MGRDVPKNRGIIEAGLVEEAIRHDTQWGPIVYSPQYSDETHVFRHISLPRKMWRLANALLAQRQLLTYDDIINRLHIPMSSDWTHYLTLKRDMTLMFKRPRRD